MLFHLYGIDRDDVAYIMDSFWVVRQNNERDHGTYRTKDRILSQPHRRLAATERRVPIDRARVVGAGGLLRALQEPWEWKRVPQGAGGATAATLRGHLPESIQEDDQRHTLDTPENRFVLAFLDLCHSIVETTRERVRSWRPSALQARVLRDCDQLVRKLGPVRGHRMWQQVGRMAHFPASSTVLQRRYGYREVFRHFVRLRLVSRIPLADEAVADLLSMKRRRVAVVRAPLSGREPRPRPTTFATAKTSSDARRAAHANLVRRFLRQEESTCVDAFSCRAKRPRYARNAHELYTGPGPTGDRGRECDRCVDRLNSAAGRVGSA